MKHYPFLDAYINVRLAQRFLALEQYYLSSFTLIGT